MSRAERAARRAEILQAVKDAMITLVLYGMTWTIFMAIIGRMLKIM